MVAAYDTIESLNSDLREFTLIAKLTGSPITTGTVNWYLLALTGANSGKWWKTADGTWAASETANAMTHRADGHWTRDPVFDDTSPWTDGVEFLEYAKESGNLHVPVSRKLKAAYTAYSAVVAGSSLNNVINLATNATYYTFADAIEMLIDFIGPADASPATRRKAKQSCIDALREFSQVSDWRYFERVGRVSAVSDYATGTIAYTHSTRTVALTGGTFPDWSARGCLLVGNAIYDVVSNPSTTTLILDGVLNPGENLASGTTYILFQEAYPFPNDFIELLGLRSNSNTRSLEFLAPGDYLDARRLMQTPAQPIRFTIMGDPRAQTQNVIRFNPPPSTAETFDCVYRRRPRNLRTDEYSTGTVNISGATVTSASLAEFDTVNHPGAIFRIGTASKAPTGLDGANPFIEEHVIVAVTDSSTLILDSEVTNDVTGVKFTISDPVDVDPTMLNAFKWCARKSLADIVRMKDRRDVSGHYVEELKLALAGNSKYDSRGIAGGGGSGGSGRLTLMDISDSP